MVFCWVLLANCKVDYSYKLYNHLIFQELGIPGPSPNFLFGNLLDLWGKKGFHDIYQIWNKMYGKIFGYFEGPSPILVTSDPDFIQEVFVKQFQRFHARKVSDPEKDERVHMFFAMGDRWRRLRSVVSPAFSSKKMREMTPEINKTIDGLLNTITECKGKSVDFLCLFQRLTLDAIVHCAFGLDSQAVNDDKEPFLTHCRGVIEDTTKQPLLYLCGYRGEVYAVLVRNIKLTQVNCINFFISIQLQSRKNDLVQLLINARINNINDPMFNINGKNLSDQEIVQQMLLFLLAGYETTSTSLSYIFHELANNPDIQDKLRTEIIQHYPKEDDQPSYENVRYLKYLDWVVKETLRKYPLASVIVARKCMETCVVNGLTIPKGMVIQADLWSLHRDNDVWGEGDMELFNPERFSPENSAKLHPCAWCPFGAGPRMCAGLRFAVLEIKMTIAVLLKKFRFTPAADHRLEMSEGATISPKYGVRLNAELLMSQKVS
ncbi:hypothetical protein LOTGIDRAFT_119744 [Lottia gigantea]|uniref:Thromboxane-A synthase n=1 Tax=Lottia gigantea TaxID=225164 RepID=V4ADC7_LOTGI|nr:hypothetical protein LOTGIDRAFT_119744 [Lottia gigantea]ESO93125.1 hypothetical protein LOTGIDRAFT_119744 [Lottia gigantea]